MNYPIYRIIPQNQWSNANSTFTTTWCCKATGPGKGMWFNRDGPLGFTSRFKFYDSDGNVGALPSCLLEFALMGAPIDTL